MRLPRFRFSVRTLLVLVVIAAVAMVTAWPPLERRWMACHDAAARSLGLAKMESAAVADLERAKMWKEADHLRRSEALHRERAREMTRAFFDPTRNCILDDDLY